MSAIPLEYFLRYCQLRSNWADFLPQVSNMNTLPILGLGLATLEEFLGLAGHTPSGTFRPMPVWSKKLISLRGI
jgi:hypothetical protein